MNELESVIEKKLIDQLCCGESQWTYRPDIRTEEQLWDNFKYILEQNNKARLNDAPLSESEFAKIKNDLSHASFYEAGEWLSGENGKVYVHVQRGNETLHLLVMNNEHIAGGTSVYEVINQYQAFAKDKYEDERDRRFDVTLLINGIPMIHIELKNKDHSYIEGYNQIKKYIAEGKFRGIFSNVQMFVVSNAVDTKYFSAARDTELKKKFITGWIDKENNPVCNYLDFAKEVLRIPQAHEMVAKYTVLDYEAKKLLILRPYQIHAISAMREASKAGKSGYIWHTTLFMDRQPMAPQNIIQAFSRTNRLFDATKTYGQIVTFQAPDEFKEAIDNALRIYSRGHDGDEIGLSENWENIEKAFEISVKSIHVLGRTPEEISSLSRKQKKIFVKLFRDLDYNFAHLKAFSTYTEDMLETYDFSELEYEDYAAMYKNIMEELKDERGEDDPSVEEDDEPVLDDYDLIAYNKLRIDFEYIVELLQGFVDSLHSSCSNHSDEEAFADKIKEIREMIQDFAKTNTKLGDLLKVLVNEIEEDRDKYIGQDISVLVNKLRYEAIDKEIVKFAERWYIAPEEVKYEVFHFKEGKLENETNFKKKADYALYKEIAENPVSKLKFYKNLIEDFKTELMDKIAPLLV